MVKNNSDTIVQNTRIQNESIIDYQQQLSYLRLIAYR